MTTISKFSIRGLFGKKDVNLVFNNKAQIYIGENGLGKTTILNALYFLLSCDFKNLNNIIFQQVDIVVNKKTFSFSKDEIKLYLQSQEGETRRPGFYHTLTHLLTDADVRKLQAIVRSGRADMVRLQEVNQFLKAKGLSYNAPGEYILDIVTQIVIDRAEINKIGEFQELIANQKLRILYFPTYRRIEKDVRLMLKERKNRSRGNYSFRELDLENSFLRELAEAVHSGMSDIKQLRDDVIRTISDVSRKQLDALSVDLLKKQISETPVKIALKKEDISKIDAIIHKSQMGLTPVEQDHLMQMVQTKDIYKGENRILLYHLTRLVDIYNSYEVYDRGIKSFVEVCNGYLRDKRFVYNEADLTLDLIPTISAGAIQELIDLDILSSGEKQLIALFATIYLAPQQHFIMLIDEPELSLSIYWQRKLLPDVMKSPDCDFLFAVTHSPFIFENELRDCTTGMNEFVES